MGRLFVPLEELGLSRYTFCRLICNGFTTVNEVVRSDFNSLLHINGMTMMRVCEIIDKIDNLSFNFRSRHLYKIDFSNISEYDKIKVTLNAKFSKGNHFQKGKLFEIASERLFQYPDNTYCHVDINVLDLDLRCHNVLISEGITDLGHLLVLDQSELCLFNRLGMTCARDIVGKLEQYMQVVENRVDIPSNGVFDLNGFAEALYFDINVSRLKILNKAYIYDRLKAMDFCFDGREVKSCLCDPDIMQVLYDDPVFDLVLKSDFLNIFKTKSRSCTIDDLNKYLPKSFVCLGRTQTLVDEMMANGRIDYYVGKYTLMYEFLSDYVESISDPKKKSIIIAKLDGKSCRSISIELGYSYNMVSQYVKSTFNFRIKVFEGRYRYWFMKYNIDKDLFCELFNIDMRAYNYLSEVFVKGEGTIDDMLLDPYVSSEMRDRIVAYSTKGRVFVDDECLNTDKLSILEHLMSKYKDAPVSIDVIANDYISFCEDHRILTRLNTKNNIVSLSRTLASDTCRFAVMSRTKKFRYYDIDSYDVRYLIEHLDFSNYMDAVISVRKLYDDHLVLMKTYGIYNSDELHNILRKNMGYLPDYVNMIKMPHINVGEVDRRKQALDLMKNIGPQSSIQLSRIFESKYGIDRHVFDADWLPFLSEYYHDGKYAISNS